MNDRHEQLSALLDDFRDREEDRAALTELQSDVNQQYTLQRYGMIGDAMRNELPQHVQLDFSARVRSAISAEQSHSASAVEQRRQNRVSSWWSSLFKPLAGLAVAASVAVVAVTLMPVQQPSGEQPAVVASTADLATQARVEQFASRPVANGALLVSGNAPRVMHDNLGGTQWKIKRGEADIQTRLNAYLINHNEHSNTLNGIIPQARVVGFDAQR